MPESSQHIYIQEAIKILQLLDLPKAQQNERSALTLLALLDLQPEKKWKNAENPLLGVTPIINWIAQYYGKQYAPNTRETIRRQTLHQFMQAGLVCLNPDDPQRAINSPANVYQITAECLDLLQTFEKKSIWNQNLAKFKVKQPSLAKKYAEEREKVHISIPEMKLSLSPGKHSQLIRDFVELFIPQFIKEARLIYLGDTGEKWGFFDEKLAEQLNCTVNSHGKMPDIIAWLESENWLILAEAVTSHGPVDPKRKEELTQLFAECSAGLVFVSAFPDRNTMKRYSSEIAWETEVWTADNPTHMIHFNGSRFLGPYFN